jgi:hypothetical protein
MRFSRSSRHPAAGIVGINLPAKEEETHDTILSNRTHNVKDGIWHSSLGSLISHPLFHLGRKNSSRGSGVSSSWRDWCLPTSHRSTDHGPAGTTRRPASPKNKNLPHLALVPLTFLPKSSVNQTIKEMADGLFSIVVANWYYNQPDWLTDWTINLFSFLPRFSPPPSLFIFRPRVIFPH